MSVVLSLFLSSGVARASQVAFLPMDKVLKATELRNDMLRSLDTDTSVNDAQKQTIKHELEVQERYIVEALKERCGGAKTCTDIDYADAVGDAYARYIDETTPDAPDEGLQLAGSRWKSLLVGRARAIAVYTVFGLFVTLVGETTGLIPESFESTARVVAIVVGGIAGNAGAFFLDRLNNNVRTTFFWMKNGATKAAQLGIYTAAFLRIWQFGQSAPGTVIDGRNRMKDAFLVAQTIITNALTVRNDGDAHRALGLGLARNRQHHWETVPTDEEFERMKNAMVTNEDSFGAAIIDRFGNTRSYLVILAHALFSEPDVRRIDLKKLNEPKTKQRLDKWLDFYHSMLTQWMPPTKWHEGAGAGQVSGEKRLRTLAELRIPRLLALLSELEDAREKLAELRDQAYENLSDDDKARLASHDLIELKEFEARSTLAGVCEATSKQVIELELRLNAG